MITATKGIKIYLKNIPFTEEISICLFSINNIGLVFVNIIKYFRGRWSNQGGLHFFHHLPEQKNIPVFP